MRRHLVFAVIAGMLAPCVALAIISAFLVIIHPEPDKSSVFAVVGSLVALVYTIPAVLLYALPLFLLLRKFRLANLTSCVLSALAPIVFAALYPPMAATPDKLALFGAFFLVSALGFWFFARKTIHSNPEA
jgi:hypothetical protein